MRSLAFALQAVYDSTKYDGQVLHVSFPLQVAQVRLQFVKVLYGIASHTAF